MQIQVNGETKTVDAKTVGELVGALGLDLRRVAVEKNREIVPRATYADAALNAGDQIEIVQFIGGG